MPQTAPSRKRVALLLSVLLLFFGVALFSTLHQHKSGVCSFNDLEHQLISLAEAAAVLAPSTVFLEAEIPQQIQPPAIRHTLPARGRAPPSDS
ncbi:MAG: hypothetical protein EXQ57_02890 [Bryobacterales bacterium]|nr:hypothetical protein [Bryobacterales bacterium]